MASEADVEAVEQSIDRYLRGERDEVELVESWVLRELRRRRIADPVEQRELIQTVHSRLLANFRGQRFRHESQLGTYVTSVTRYTVFEQLRRRLGRAPLPDVDEAPAFDDPYHHLLIAEQRQLLRQAVARCPGSCRELWKLILVENLSYPEIASRLGVPEGTVKSRAWNCRRTLQRMLERLPRPSLKRDRD